MFRSTDNELVNTCCVLPSVICALCVLSMLLATVSQSKCFPVEKMCVGLLREYYQMLVVVKTQSEGVLLQVKVRLSLSLIDTGDTSAYLESW